MMRLGLGLGLLLLGLLGLGFFGGLPEVHGELQLPSQDAEKVHGTRRLSEGTASHKEARASSEEAEEPQRKANAEVEEAEDADKAAKAEVQDDIQQLADGLATESRKVRNDVLKLADRLADESQKVAAASSGEEAKDRLQQAEAQVRAVEKSAESTADHIEKLTERLDAEDREAVEKSAQSTTETHDTTTGTGIPWNAVWPCAIMVFLIYIYLGIGIFTPSSMDYQRLDVDRRDPALILAAALYWVVMPVALVTLGFGATCEEGAPNAAYITYGACFAIHFACLCWAMTDSLKLHLHDSTPKLIVMLVLAALEHFDMASDALFAGMSAACSEDITDLWLQSWRDVPGGDFIVPVLSKLGFSGVALTMFVTHAYLPQVLLVWSFYAPFVALALALMVVLWASFGWVIGLAVILVVYALVVCSELGKYEIAELQDEAFCSDDRISLYLGAEIVPAPGPELKRPLAIIGTKIVLENLLQLWLQSSYLSLSFDTMDDFARWQAMASIGVGLLVAGGKGLQIAAPAVPLLAEGAGPAFQRCDLFTIGAGGVGVCMMLAGLGGLAWVLAKVIFIFRCDSHVWNLSTGCVIPET